MTSESTDERAATRRSRRTSPAQSPAPAEQPRPLTRAELRRAAQASPTVVPQPLARPTGDVVVGDDEQVEAVTPTVVPGPPVSRRSRRAATSPSAGDAATVSAELVVDLPPVAAPTGHTPVPGATELVEPTVDDALLARITAEGSPSGPEVSAWSSSEAGAPASDVSAAAEADPFASAARLFSFTGELPVAPAAETTAADVSDEAPAEPAPVADAVTRGSRRRLSAKRVTAASFSIGIIGVVGLLTVGMTTAPQAVAAAGYEPASTNPANIVVGGDVAPGGDGKGQIQAYVAPATVQNSALNRSDYSTGSIAATAASLGITRTSNFFVNNPNSPIQWPFALGVPISYGFGWRTDSDTGTEFHEGADFTPGEGAHVQAIADGTVRIATENGGAYGVTVVLDHQIDGQLVSTRYAHMLVGSLQVKPGDTVKVGQYLGRTGDTGFSFGAHTHVEVLLNGTTAIDPIAWLRQHAGG